MAEDIPSILTSTKKILGIAESYEAFDVDIMTHINSTFSLLNQLGIGPDDGFSIEGKEEVWEDFGVPNKVLRMVRTYIFLKVRLAFDPPATSFHIDAIKAQIQEHEHRLSWFREAEQPLEGV